MNKLAGLKSFFIACLAGWAIICGICALYARDTNVPAWLGIPLLAAFLAEFSFYLVPGFESVRGLLTERFSKAALGPLLAASAVAPYLIYTVPAGQVRLQAFLLLLGIALLVSYWFVFLPAAIGSDLGFLALLAAVILSKVLKGIYVAPIARMELQLHGLVVRIPPDLLGHMMTIRLGASALLLQRRFAGLRFGFVPSWQESWVGLRYFLYFLPVGIPLGWWLGITMHGRSGPVWQALFVFFGVLWVVALSEEFVFRGIVQQWLARVTGRPVAALAAASVIFGLCHLPYHRFPNWGMAAMATVAGGFYGMAFQRGGVRASMVSHALVVTVWLVWLR